MPAASLLRVDPRDGQFARAIAGELGLEIEVEPGHETLGGVEVAAGDGLTVRNTLDERLRNAEPALRVLAGELLQAEAPRLAEGGP